VQSFLPHMRSGGAMIATGSETGSFGPEHLPGYSACQSSIHALTRSHAMQLFPKWSLVEAVATRPVGPALVPTHTGATPGEVAERRARTGPGRPAPPEEIAPAYVFFASEADSSFVTGQVLAELGGVTP